MELVPGAGRFMPHDGHRIFPGLTSAVSGIHQLFVVSACTKRAVMSMCVSLP